MNERTFFRHLAKLKGKFTVKMDGTIRTKRRRLMLFYGCFFLCPIEAVHGLKATPQTYPDSAYALKINRDLRENIPIAADFNESALSTNPKWTDRRRKMLKTLRKKMLKTLGLSERPKN